MQQKQTVIEKQVYIKYTIRHRVNYSK